MMKMKAFCILIAILKSTPLFAERGRQQTALVRAVATFTGRVRMLARSSRNFWAGSFHVSKTTSSRPLIWRLDNTRFARQRCQGLFAARRLRGVHRTNTSTQDRSRVCNSIRGI